MAVAFAKRMELLRASEIREMLKITQRPEVISFAGGLPAPEVFPLAELERIFAEVIRDGGREALQYSTTEGNDDLRRLIAGRMRAKFAANADWRDVLITNGSQQALDLTGKLLLDPGDVVLVESPTYLAAISAFKAYQPTFVAVPTDEDGMIPGALAEILEKTKNVKLIYIIPDFQNPTGRTWSLERRRQFAELINEYEIPVIEDNAYGELRYEGERLPAVKSYDTKGLVVFVSTFSKTLCPGLRIGWLAAPSRFFEKYVLIKQGTDLHTSSLSQQAIARYLEKCDYDDNIARITGVYRRRRDAMVAALTKHFPDEVRFTRPAGGLFSWAQLPAGIKAFDLLTRTLEQNVAFVPGDSFFPQGGVTNTMRLNFSNMPEEKIDHGIKLMAEALKTLLK